MPEDKYHDAEPKCVRSPIVTELTNTTLISEGWQTRQENEELAQVLTAARIRVRGGGCDKLTRRIGAGKAQRDWL